MNELRHEGVIAIVDDDDSVRRALARVLRGAGYLVETHASGYSLLDSIGQSTPDCIVLDINMPGIDGFGVESELAQRGCSIPVIFITANPDASVQRRATSAGAAALLNKPVESAVLFDAIAAAIRR